jgi:hypothetical protein
VVGVAQRWCLGGTELSFVCRSGLMGMRLKSCDFARGRWRKEEYRSCGDASEDA